MDIPTYSHAEKEQIFGQFKLLPEEMRHSFVRDVTNNPDMANDPNRIAAGMQGLINAHVAMQAPEMHPFASLLTGHKDVLASFASMQGAPQLANPGDTGRLGIQLATHTQQRGNDDLGQLG